ncbi:MAG: ABC transporter permease [Patescibacteria group bacterium]|nr:ABC transporter permease [Patescibacteria group bacterium]
MSKALIVIRPKKIFRLSDLKEIWNYRELLYFFSWRDLKVRYKQTVVGILWAIIQPFITMVVFSVFFGSLAKVPSDNVPYPIFVYTGLLFWQFFSDSLGDVSNSLIGNQSIITKVYFPRLILPISSVITKLVDLSIGAVILAGLMIYYHITPTVTSLAVIPVVLIITFMSAVGLGLILAATNVKYRDVRYALPFFIQLLIFVTPVIYPASIAGKYSKILALNPMMGVVQNARAVLLGTTEVNWTLIATSLIGCIVLLFVGIYVFKKVERYFADIV